MIYLKVNKNVYNNLNLDKFIKDYPSFCSRFIALHRIVFNTLKNDLKDYPDIDIVISDKRQSTILGRFFVNKNKEHREYKFIEQKSGNPYIVLFEDNILKYFSRHKVKGFKEVFLHEFYHYRQWLLNEPLKHNRDIIKAVDNPLKVNENIQVISEALNKRG
jgi:hypothetical protein